MAVQPIALPVSLMSATGEVLPVGFLARDRADNVMFTPSLDYREAGPRRPILSARWHVPGDEDKTRARLANEADKTARQGILPGWFSNLLPEGALRDMVERGMPSGRTSDFDVIRHLGSDLPGGVVVGSGEAPGDRTVWDLRTDDGTPRIRFSLAGIQLKFSAVRRDDRLTVPSMGTSGNLIVKLPNARYPGLVELEAASLALARAAGIEVAEFDVVPSDRVDGLPDRLIAGPTVLVVARFDRTERGRIHMEDFAQILGAVGDQKYSRGNDESCVNVVRRFSRLGQADVVQAVRRLVVNLLLGNTDAHLKNWSLLYDRPTAPRLAPAYDIVALRALLPDDRMALKLRGKNDPALVSEETFVSFAKFVGLPERIMRTVVRETVEQATLAWPDLAGSLDLLPEYRANLNRHWHSLQLTGDSPAPF